tara:strand:- start:2884 stop:3885 length:1002 start_codon:yes stop_codon:yes gene_type:complete
MTSKYFSNIISDDNTLTFDLKNTENTIPIPFANALRRVLMSEINTIGIDATSINIFNNKTVLNNDFIKERLSLLPIKYTDKFVDYTFKLNVENTELEMKEIYAKDIDVYENDTKVVADKIFVYPDALFTKLKFSNKLHFEAKLKIGTTKDDGAVFNPTCVSIYRFEKDDVKIKAVLATLDSEDKKLEFQQSESERYYKKNEFDQPKGYHYEVETIGGIESKKIVEKGLEVLKNKLLLLKEYITEENTTKVVKLKSKHMKDAIDYKILNEDDTLGNIITYQLHNNTNVTYAGYYIPHPNDNLIVVRILADDTDKEMLKEINNLVVILDTLLKEW